MQYGICGDMTMAVEAARAGFDYMETGVGVLLAPRESESAFREKLASFADMPLPWKAVNCFIPADLRITGPDIDDPALEQYVTAACSRAAQAGVETIVFGSGNARAVPEGFDRASAYEQLVSFGRKAGAAAREAGVVIAVEPLNRTECNILNTVEECALYVREVNEPGLRLLADAYHMLKDGDDFESIVHNADLMAHVHIATKDQRKAPGAEACDFGPFFDALKRAEYDGRISIEGQISDPATDLPRALELMKTLE